MPGRLFKRLEALLKSAERKLNYVETIKVNYMYISSDFRYFRTILGSINYVNLLL